MTNPCTTKVFNDPLKDKFENKWEFDSTTSLADSNLEPKKGTVWKWESMIRWESNLVWVLITLLPEPNIMHELSLIATSVSAQVTHSIQQCYELVI